MNISSVRVRCDDKKRGIGIGVSGGLSARTLDAVLAELTRDSPSFEVVALVLDLRRVSGVTLAGAVSLCGFCGAVAEGKILRCDENVEFGVNLPGARHVHRLAKLGFFTLLGKLTNLVGCEVQQDLEAELRSREHTARLSREVSRQLADGRREPVVPMRLIPAQSDLFGPSEFDSAAQGLKNGLLDAFDSMFTEGKFGDMGKPEKRFVRANGELLENIFQHSGSWGIAAADAASGKSADLCYHDIGIGVRLSLTRSSRCGISYSEPTCDREALEIATEENKSSKPIGGGIGLSLVMRYLREQSGALQIRTGDCSFDLFTQRSGDLVDRYRDVPEFPGTQVNAHIPLHGGVNVDA